MINIDRLMDLVLENSNDTYDYLKSSAAYFKKHGHGVNLDKVKTPEERHINYMYHASDRSYSCVLAIAEVLLMDRGQIERMYCAARAVNRWYEMSRWEKCLPDELKQRLEDYVFNGR